MQAQAVDKDPWDDEETDPWDLPAEVSTSSLPATADNELNVEFDSDEEWNIKYPNPERHLTPQDIEARAKRCRFLRILAKTGDVKKGAAMVKLSSRALYLARARFPDFDLNWNIAIEIYKQFVVEPNLNHRAIEGVNEEIYFGGKVVGHRRVFDSGLTQFWVKANMPEKYGERTEVVHKGGIMHGVAVMPQRATSIEDWEAQAAKTLANQKMIDITPTVIEAKPNAIRIER